MLRRRTKLEHSCFPATLELGRIIRTKQQHSLNVAASFDGIVKQPTSAATVARYDVILCRLLEAGFGLPLGVGQQLAVSVQMSSRSTVPGTV